MRILNKRLVAFVVLLAAPLTGALAFASGASRLSERFEGPTVDPGRWTIPISRASGDGTFIGRTQLRAAPASTLPPAKNGDACLPIESYNPVQPSFVGTEIITRQAFLLGAGLDVTIRARMLKGSHGGIVGGLFLYSLRPGSDTLHDEIDFELVTNAPDKVQTNIYSDEPLGDGHVVFVPFRKGTIADEHAYEIKWLPGRVTWLVDGEAVRAETGNTPIRPMNFYANIWAPDHWWPGGYSAAIQPVKSKDANTMLDALCVSSVVIEPLAP